MSTEKQLKVKKDLLMKNLHFRIAKRNLHLRSLTARNRKKKIFDQITAKAASQMEFQVRANLMEFRKRRNQMECPR